MKRTVFSWLGLWWVGARPLAYGCSSADRCFARFGDAMDHCKEKAPTVKAGA